MSCKPMLQPLPPHSQGVLAHRQSYICNERQYSGPAVPPLAGSHFCNWIEGEMLWRCTFFKLSTIKFNWWGKAQPCDHVCRLIRVYSRSGMALTSGAGWCLSKWQDYSNYVDFVVRPYFMVRMWLCLLISQKKVIFTICLTSWSSFVLEHKA